MIEYQMFCGFIEFSVFNSWDGKWKNRLEDEAVQRMFLRLRKIDKFDRVRFEVDSTTKIESHIFSFTKNLALSIPPIDLDSFSAIIGKYKLGIAVIISVTFLNRFSKKTVELLESLIAHEINNTNSEGKFSLLRGNNATTKIESEFLCKLALFRFISQNRFRGERIYS